MDNDLTATSRIDIGASPAAVWHALTTPALISQYLFGTKAESTWKVGSPITYRGEYNGKTYEDKGTILAFEPERYLETTYWSSMGGLPDSPENYKTVGYRLSGSGDHTTLTITQNKNADEKSRDQSQSNWDGVLQSLKALLEK